MPNARVPFFRNARRLRLRSCLRPSHFIFALDHTPLAREEERLAHIAELAGGIFEAERRESSRKRKERHERCAWGWLLRSA
jgi:hypothetical protein